MMSELVCLRVTLRQTGGRARVATDGVMVTWGAVCRQLMSQECYVYTLYRDRALHVSMARLWRHAVNSLQSPPCGLDRGESL